jgi:hypothetical protein
VFPSLQFLTCPYEQLEAVGKRQVRNKSRVWTASMDGQDPTLGLFFFLKIRLKHLFFVTKTKKNPSRS